MGHIWKYYLRYYSLSHFTVTSFLLWKKIQHLHVWVTSWINSMFMLDLTAHCFVKLTISPIFSTISRKNFYNLGWSTKYTWVNFIFSVLTLYNKILWNLATLTAYNIMNLFNIRKTWTTFCIFLIKSFKSTTRQNAKVNVIAYNFF